MKTEDRIIDKIAIMIALSIKGRAKETAKSILALISSVECDHGKGLTAHMSCKLCKGTGYRKVMVRRWVSIAEGEDIEETTPFSPADWKDIINKSATLELEVEG